MSGTKELLLIRGAQERAKENKLPINVFNMNVKGNLMKVCDGIEVGTLVTL